MTSYEHFATKGIYQNLRFSRELRYPDYYNPIQKFESNSRQGIVAITIIVIATIILTVCV